jgi:hypothetical protein
VKPTLLHIIGGVRILHDPLKNIIYYKSNLTVDDDGDPFAYHPSNKGRDCLANAGHPGNWWGIVTDSKGKPVIQKGSDPAPGYYISTTSLQDPKKKLTDPARYVNAWTIPFVALPPQLFDHVKLGDLGTAIYREQQCHFIVVDSAGKGHIGEGSAALAQYLGINNNPKDGGLDDPLIGYILYPSSGTGLPLTTAQIQARAEMVIGARGIKPSQYFLTTTKLRPQKTTRKVTVRR